MIEFLNIDCMDYMKTLPDKAFDIAICDIPYGINVCNMAYLKELNTTVRQNNGTRINPNRGKEKYSFKEWDKNPPPQSYFEELRRVSKHQIIFGIDYVNWVCVGAGRIKWDKGMPDGVSFNRYETAYCSMISNTIEFPLLWAGMCQAKSLIEPMTQQGNKKLNEKRIHPCHKPVMLYAWLIKNYCNPGWKILDTHGGSMSSAIAAEKLGFDMTICELDKDYFDAGVKRFKKETDKGLFTGMNL